MRKLLLLFVLTSSFAVLTGCDFHVEKGNVPAKLDLLTKTFGIQWPTNCAKQQGASMSADRGGQEIVARLEVTDSNFASWRESGTNKLQEFEWFKVAADPKLEKRFGWWDCSKFPASRITAYMSNRRVGNNKFVGSLDVFVVRTNGTCVMYIDGTIL